MTDDSWYVVRNTPGVTGFVGSSGAGSKPTALLPEEIEVVLKRMGVDESKIEVDFEIGDTVQVKEGPFATLQDRLKNLIKTKGK